MNVLYSFTNRAAGGICTLVAVEPPLQISADLLLGLGYGALTEEQGNRLLRAIYSTLEEEVGMWLALEMTEQQLDEFEGYFKRRDDGGAYRWLQQNFPNHEDIIRHIYAELTESLRHVAKVGRAGSPETPEFVPGDGKLIGDEQGGQAT